MDAAYRWTIDEYVLRFEQGGSDLREIVVEGEFDRDAVVDALNRWEMRDVEVRDAVFISPPPGETDPDGATGIRATLVQLAGALHEASKRKRVLATIRVVIDRDYGQVPDAGDYLMVTDGHSIESYALAPTVLDRFARLVLGRAPTPRGKGGVPDQRRATVGGKGIYERLLPAAIGLGASRMVALALSPSVAVGERWGRYVSSDSDGNLSVDAKRLIRNRLTSKGRGAEVEAALSSLQEREAEVRAEPQRLVRGHDFVSLVLMLLQSTWGRKFAKDFPVKSESVLARQLILCVEGQVLDESRLFSTLRAVFEAADP